MQYFVYVLDKTSEECYPPYHQMSVETDEAYANELLEKWLDIHFPNQWEWNGNQHVFKDWNMTRRFCNHVPGHVTNFNFQEAMQKWWADNSYTPSI